MAPAERKVQRRGRTLSYKTYGLFRWLWNKKARDDIRYLIDYAVSGDLQPLTDRNQGKQRLESVLGRPVTEEEFPVIRRGIFDLMWIKENQPDILPQLRSAGEEMFQVDLNSIVASGMPRAWRHSEKGSLSFTLLNPEIGKAAAFETSEGLTGISLFGKFHLENVQFYSTFNRIKGVKGRRMVPVSEGLSMADISFLFRTVSDLKTIYQSKDLSHFTFVSTQSMEAESFQLGTHFILLGKISGFHTPDEHERSGEKIAEIADPTGTLQFSILDEDLLRSSKGPVNSIVERFLNIPEGTSRQRIETDYCGYAIILGYWSLNDAPYVIKIVPLFRELDSEYLASFYRKAYLNLRRKARTEVLSSLFSSREDPPDEVHSSDKKWTYIIESKWEKTAFLYLLNSKFTVDQTLLSRPNLKSICTYIAINPHHAEFYLSEDVEKQFAEHYNLPADKRCEKCGSELYFVSPIMVANLLSMDGHRLTIRVNDVNPVYAGFLKESLARCFEKISLLSSCGTAEAVSKLLLAIGFTNSTIGAYDVMKNMPENYVRDIKQTLDAITSVIINGKEIPMGTRMPTDVDETSHPIWLVFDFSKFGANAHTMAEKALLLMNPEKVSMVLNNKHIYIQLGKCCPQKHLVLDGAGKKCAGLLDMITQEWKHLILDESRKIFDKTYQQFTQLANFWSDRVDTLMMYKLFATDQEKSNIISKFNEIVNTLEKHRVYDVSGQPLDISSLREISTEDIIFLTLCRQIKRGKIPEQEGWKTIIEIIKQAKSEFTDSHAMHSGVVMDSGTLLKSVALRYTRFNYDRVFRKPSPFTRENEFYENDLRMLLLRAIELDTKRQNAYRNLRKANLSGRSFDLLCRRIMSGEIHSLVAADLFLQRMSQIVGRPRPSMTRKRQKMTSPPVQERSLPRPFSKTGTKPRQEISDKRIPPNRLDNYLADLLHDWKRLQEAKAKTHQHLHYVEMKKEFQLEFDNAITALKNLNPLFKKLQGASVEWKTVKNFFKLISQLDSYSNYNITSILQKI